MVFYIRQSNSVSVCLPVFRCLCIKSVCSSVCFLFLTLFILPISGPIRSIKQIRKSSWVNARGIQTAAYQVLHVLSCPWVSPLAGVPPILTWSGGYPGTLLTGVPPPAGPGWGTPTGGTDKQSETITSRLILRMRSVNITLSLSRVINMTKTGSLLLSVFIASSKYQAGRGASI